MPVKKIPGVYVEEISFARRSIEGVSMSDAVFVGECPAGAENAPTPVVNFGEFERRFGVVEVGRSSHRSELMAQSVRGYFQNGGKKAWIVRVLDHDRRTDERVWPTLDNAEGAGTVCLPGSPWIEEEKTRIRGWLDFVERTSRWMLISDPPPGVELRSAADVESLDLPASNYAALYYPWVRVRREKPSRETVLVPPCGHVAGVWARTDVDRGVWKAPAGVDARLNGVADLEFDVGVAEQDVLNPAGINALRDLPGHGPVIWGARTLAAASNSEWKYVNIRRFTNYVEHSIESGIGWVVFEPNDQPLWSSIRQSIETFMHGIYRQGALQGTRPEEAYFVRCDRSTMTEDDVLNGIVNIVVGFAPLKPAEFVILRISRQTVQNGGHDGKA